MHIYFWAIFTCSYLPLQPSQLAERLYMSESDYRRQILTYMYKNGPRTERNKMFLMAVDPLHRYSNKSGKDELRHL